MFFADEEQAIRARFKTQWEAVYPTIPIDYDAVPFTPTVGNPYVALHVLNGEGHQVTIQEDPVRRFAGVIQVDINVAAGEGVKKARQYADTVSGIFERAQFSFGQSGLIRCYTPSLAPPMVSTDRLKLIVSTNYLRDVQAGAPALTTGTAPTYPGKPRRYALTGLINSVNTVFTLPIAPDPAVLEVYKNGVLQLTTAYSLVGNTITFTTPPDGTAPADTLEAFA